jgi:two-component system nitrate/nitrite response regulator NarL
MKAVGHADHGPATAGGIARGRADRGANGVPGVVIVDDHPVYRDGLARAVDACDELRLVAEAGSGSEAIERIEELRPEVAAVDMRMPGVDGLGVLAALGGGDSGTRVLILSAYLDGDIAYRALAEGASGFIAKDSSRQAICDAIITVARGGVALCADVELDLAAEIRRRTRIERDVLTGRELEILEAVAAGGSAAAIGARLHLSPTTVKSHLRSIYAKLEVGDRAAAVAEAMRRGLLE